MFVFLLLKKPLRQLLSITVDGCRLSSIEMTTFKAYLREGLEYETFYFVFPMAPDTRWANVKFPAVNSYAQAMGIFSFGSLFLWFTNSI
jgi:hypothetical protein